MEVTDLVLLRLIKPHMLSAVGVFGALLLLCGVSVERVMLVSKCISILTKIGHDLCIYFFTFVTFHAMLEWLENTENNS
jgi:hypothetical protein